MKVRADRTTALCAGVAALLVGSLAQSQTDGMPSIVHGTTRAAQRFPQPVRVGDLIERPVLLPGESRPLVGHVAAVIRSGGGIEIVMTYGGFFGIGARSIAVPVDAMALLGDELEIMTFNAAQLDGFPTYQGTAIGTLGAGEFIEMGLARPSH